MMNDIPVSDVGTILNGFLKNIGWRLHFTWNKEGESSNVDCSSELILNADESKRLPDKKMENLRP